MKRLILIATAILGASVHAKDNPITLIKNINQNEALVYDKETLKKNGTSVIVDSGRIYKKADYISGHPRPVIVVLHTYRIDCRETKYLLVKTQVIEDNGAAFGYQYNYSPSYIQPGDVEDLAKVVCKSPEG